MPFRSTIILLLLTLRCVHAAERVQFNRDVRPILSDKCFHCHGFDPKKREADLRLDMREEAVKEGHIVPGQPDKSLIIERILSHDADEVMPPPKAKLAALTTAEIDTLRRWIKEGAEYEKHWAFISVKPDAAEGKSIDSIVEAGLAKRGLKLQPPADAVTLRRRLSFDLTGLPPTEFQISNLESQIAKLLASPQYGERMAADWLDISRYADSYGFQVDRERQVWMWRDWVVKAFNDNLPFDQFVTWQLAGDLLPNPSLEQRLATAFNRLHQQESEGGSVEEEYRVEYVCDRVQTVATAFLGLTFECARCHDHKYDPISQKEYYGLFSMLQNIDEAGLYSFFTTSAPTPALALMDSAAELKAKQLHEKIASLEKQIASKTARQIPLKDGVPEDLGQQLAHFTFDVLKGNKLADAMQPAPIEAPKDAKDKTVKPKDISATLNGENRLTAGKLGQAIQFTGDDSVDTPVGNFHRYEPFSLSLWIQTPDLKERAVVLHRSKAWTDAASRGYELLIEEGKLKWSLIHFWPGDAISIRSSAQLPLKEWIQVIVTHDGSGRAAGLGIYLNGKRAEVEIVRDHLTKDITGGGGDTISLGQRFRDRGFKGGLVDDLRVFSRDLSKSFEAKDSEKIAALQSARAELTKLIDAQPEIMVMQEMDQPKKAYTLTRGEYDKRAEEVGPVTPASLSPFPKDAPQNRLGLARWLTSPDHPLMARVTVNRIWNSLFGRGLVKTAEDFGSQGERPLYPDLLDYLAARFMKSGWDVKALIKEIVSSRVYQQRSIADAQTMADDPENQWLARGPRFRLPAEMIRDNALAASGLLNLKLGGAPVNPYEMTEAFKPANPTDSYRRSLYTTWRRTSPPPAMIAFDAPRRAVCTAKRERTDSPLQALILLNGTQYVEAARVLGEKLHLEAKGDVSKMIDSGFLRCLSRLPDAKERSLCVRLYEEQLAHFQAHTESAEALLKTGKAKPNPALPSPAAAAAAVLAQALMNHDECVVKR